MAITLEELLQRYATGERNFSKIILELDTPFRELDDWYLQGVDLSGASFRDADLHKIAPWMHGMNLSGADLRDVDLIYAHLIEANLSGANLSRANLLAANFSRANLSEVNLSYAKLGLARFISTNLERANVTDADIVGARFENVNLKGSYLSDFGRAHGAYFRNTIVGNGDILVEESIEG